MSNPFISLIIPAKNAQSTLKKCIDSLLNLNYPYYEVIVIDDGSTDETKEILSGFQNIKVITTAGVGPSQARNIGIAQAQGEFVAFTDADCIVDREWLMELLKGFTDEDVAGVGGIQKGPDDDSPFGKVVQEFFCAFGFISDYMKSGIKIKPTSHNPTCNVIYRKKVLLELGGFLSGLWPGEDVELDYRITKIGYKLIYNPKAVVYHYRTNSFEKFCIMMYKYGCAQGILVRKYGFFRKVHFLPFILLCLISLIVFAASISHSIIKIVFFLSVIIFLSFLIGRIFIFKKKKNVILFIILSVCGSTSWNIGFIKSLIINNIIG